MFCPFLSHCPPSVTSEPPDCELAVPGVVLCCGSSRWWPPPPGGSRHAGVTSAMLRVNPPRSWWCPLVSRSGGPPCGGPWCDGGAAEPPVGPPTPVIPGPPPPDTVHSPPTAARHTARPLCGIIMVLAGVHLSFCWNCRASVPTWRQCRWWWSLTAKNRQALQHEIPLFGWTVLVGEKNY